MLEDVTPSTLADLVRPLCKETADLLKPWDVGPYDRLLLKMEDDWTFRAAVRREAMKSDGTKFHNYPLGNAARWAHSIPERHHHEKEDEWSYAATDVTALLILATWPRGQIVASESASKTLDLLALRFIHQFKTSALPQAVFKSAKALPSDVQQLVAEREVEGTCSDYQLLASWCGAQADGGYAYFMDTGTGKTITSIEAAVIEAKKKGLDRPLKVLVVCPRQVRFNWGEELRRFSKLPYAFIDCYGDKFERAKRCFDVAATQGVDYVVMTIGYGHVRNSAGTLMFLDWDIVIADESDNFKSHTTHTWKAMEKLRDVSKKRFALTATPISNTLNDLWTQLEFLGKGYSGFHSWKAFRKFYGVFAGQGSGIGRLVGYQNVPLLQERLTRLSYVISIEDAIPDLPPVTRDVVTVELSDEQREAYDALKNTLKYEIQDQLDKSEQPLSVTMNNVLTMLLRLAQVASGYISYDAVYDHDTGDLVRDKRIDRFDPNPKLEELVNLIKSTKNKVIVWSCWTQNIKQICSRLTLEGIGNVHFYGGTSEKDRMEALERFNKMPVSDCQVLVGNPQCGGVGLNLLGQADEETDCDWIINYASDWSFRKRKQGAGRNRRRGTRVPQRYTDMLCEDTIDEDIYDTVARKAMTSMNLQDLRAILDKVFKAKEKAA